VENKACSQDSDEEQGLRWLNFMAQQSESGDKLLKAMELIDDDQELCHLVAAEQELEEDNLQSAEQIARCYEQFQVFLTEEGKEMSAKTAVSPDLEGLKMLRLWDAEDQGIEQSRTVTELEELSKETVRKITEARVDGAVLQRCDNRGKKEKWGPILVERKRRGQDNGVPILKKAMDLKKRNLESVQGNPFATLQFENLNHIAVDVNLRFGSDSTESEYIINNLIKEDQQSYVKFVGENPETLLPIDLDLESDLGFANKEAENAKDCDSPAPSVKDEESPPLWTEVVRRGKTKSRSNKIKNDDMRILEY
jgi:hypothetical protein